MCSIADLAAMRERDGLQVQTDWRQDLNFAIYGMN